MTAITVTPAAAGLHGRLRVPGDKSISHRALLLAARARGRSVLTGLSDGDDVVRTGRAVAAFGAAISSDDGMVTVDGGDLHEPDGVVDVGNSGTGIRLLAGWATGVPGIAVLAGDESIARRPMGRVVEPLRQMGARIDGRRDGGLPPLVVRGGGTHGITYAPPVASAQVKGAVLLAGLGADGPTTVVETVPTRRHSEELLALAGADITVSGGSVVLRPGRLSPFRLDVPGDPSQAAFWIVAACITPGSDLAVEHVYVGHGRAGFVDVLVRMGADVTLDDHDPVTHTATIRARSGPLSATTVAGDEVPGLIDEVPALAVAAACATGTTTFADAAELAVKESDRIATTVAALRALGAVAEPRPDGLVVDGGRLAGGAVDSHGDHRIAMAAAVAGLAAAGPVRIDGWQAVATSYPTFLEDLQRCVS